MKKENRIEKKLTDKITKPELLSPGGSFEKAKMALLYGADSVYVGGEDFGLRAAAANLSRYELEALVKFAHQKGKKVYVTLNNFFHDEDLLRLKKYAEFLQEIKIDAAIVSDLGAITLLRENNFTPQIHLSTQANCLNASAANFYKQLGVQRIVLGREVSLPYAEQIFKESQVELEMFIHGALCMSYSGNCVISNYTHGRDSNRGGCSQSCRFEYEWKEEKKKDSVKEFFLSSKDLKGISILKHFFEGPIACLKIEGRMKSLHYVSCTTKAYSQALAAWEDILLGRKSFEELRPLLEYCENLLNTVSNREYTSAPLLEEDKYSLGLGRETVFQGRQNMEEYEQEVAGTIIEVNPHKQEAILKVAQKFPEKATLRALSYSGLEECSFVLPQGLVDIKNRKITTCGPSTLLKIPYDSRLMAPMLVRYEN